MAKKATEDTKHLYKRGKIWWIQVMRKGERIIKSTGETNIKKAREKRDEELNPLHLKDVKKRAEAVYEKMRTADDNLTQELAKIENRIPATPISEGWQTYLDQSNRPDSGATTLRQYEFQYEAFANWFKDNHPQADKEGIPIRWELRHVTQDDAERYAGHLIKKVSASTFNRHLNLLALVWKVLEKPARLAVSPWKDIGRKRFAIHSRRELTVDELQNVCNAAQGEMRLLLALGIYCGLRLGDAACLDWSNVDLVKGVISLIPMKTARRSQKRITLPIHRTLFAMLMDIPAVRRKGFVMPELAARYGSFNGALARDVARLFNSVDIKTGANSMTKSEREAEAKAKEMAKAEGKEPPKDNLKGKAAKEKRASADCGFHSLRHTFVSLCAAGGVPQSVVQALVGHGSPAMTAHYTHIGIETAQNAVALLPDVTQAKGLPEAINATQAEIEGLQKTLERMTLSQLQTLAAKVNSMIGELKTKGTLKGEADKQVEEVSKKGV